MRLLSQYELNVMVGNKPIFEYQHEGNTFVEGRKGSEFELQFKNTSYSSVLAIPSVDGLSALDGTPATTESMGFVVHPHTTLRVPGWRLDQSNIAKFLFLDKEKSYARTQSDGRPTQAGVIGFLVYLQEQPPTTRMDITKGGYAQPWGNPPANHTPYYNGLRATAADVNMNTTYSTCMSPDYIGTAATAAQSSVTTSSPFEMGTGWGAKADFQTNQTTFNKGTLVGTMLIYYDSRKNLSKRGIQLVRDTTADLNSLPNAFGNVGCIPPPGWHG